MVRLVVLSFIINLLVACSGQTVLPGDTPVSVQEIPAVTVQPADQQAGNKDQGSTMDFTQGQHHPAVAGLFAKSQEAKEQQNWDAAMLYLEQARQIQPRNAAILYRQAWLKIQEYQPEQAKQLLNRAKVYSAGKIKLQEKIQQLFDQLEN